MKKVTFKRAQKQNLPNLYVGTVDDKVVGTITSGEWGHRVGKNLAYAFVNLDVAELDVML